MGPDEFAAEETQRAKEKKASILAMMKEAYEQTSQAIAQCVAENKRLERAVALNNNRLNALKQRLAAFDTVRVTESLL